MRKFFPLSLLFLSIIFTGCLSPEKVSLPKTPYDLANQYLESISTENIEILSEIFDEQILLNGATHTIAELVEVYISDFAITEINSLDLWSVEIEFDSQAQTINIIYSMKVIDSENIEELKIKRVVLKTWLVDNCLKVYEINEEDLNTPDWLLNEYNQSFVNEDIGTLEAILTDPVKIQGDDGSREAFLNSLAMIFGFSETSSIEVTEKQIEYNGDKTYTISMTRSVTSISNGFEVVNPDNTILKIKFWNSNMRISEIESEPINE